MKTRNSSVWMYSIMVVAILFMASCGNSQKKKQRDEQKTKAEQPMDSVTVIESETVVVAVDSIAPDGSVVKKNVTTPKKTK